MGSRRNEVLPVPCRVIIPRKISVLLRVPSKRAPSALLNWLVALVLCAACATRPLAAGTVATAVVPAPSPTAKPTSTVLAKTPTPALQDFKIVAYVTDAIVESVIPYDKLTHINYAFLTPKADGTFNPISNVWKLQRIAKNAHARGVKVLVSVGGWGWEKQFEAVASTPELRSIFVRNLKAVVDGYRIDGADIDWEYPATGQSAENFLALIRELRVALPGRLVTAAVVSHGVNAAGILPEALELFDFVNVMAYDGPEHGTLQQFNQGLTFWADRGVPANRIVLGLPFYARVKNSAAEGMQYAKLVRAYPEAAQVDAFEVYGATQVYNGIPTIYAKTKIAVQQAGGVMFWNLDSDALGELSLVAVIYQAANMP